MHAGEGARVVGKMQVPPDFRRLHSGSTMWVLLRDTQCCGAALQLPEPGNVLARSLCFLQGCHEMPRDAKKLTSC